MFQNITQTIVILLLFNHVHYHMSHFPVNFPFKVRNVTDSRLLQDCSKINPKDNVNVGYGSHMVFTPLGMRKERSVIGDLAYIKVHWVDDLIGVPVGLTMEAQVKVDSMRPHHPTYVQYTSTWTCLCQESSKSSFHPISTRELTTGTLIQSVR